MLDLSDGLAGDIHHLCTASKVGAQIDAERLPIGDSTRQAAQVLGIDPIHLALSGGEDYELLVALAPDDLESAQHALAPTPLTKIGVCTDVNSGIRLRRDGTNTPLRPDAWTHF
jgi:thiamine-monophosphate kinase